MGSHLCSFFGPLPFLKNNCFISRLHCQSGARTEDPRVTCSTRVSQAAQPSALFKDGSYPCALLPVPQPVIFSFPPVYPKCLSRSLPVSPVFSGGLLGPPLCSRVSPQGCFSWFPCCHHLTQHVPRFCAACPPWLLPSATLCFCAPSRILQPHPHSRPQDSTPSPGLTSVRSSSGRTSQLLTGKAILIPPSSIPASSRGCTLCASPVSIRSITRVTHTCSMLHLGPSSVSIILLHLLVVALLSCCHCPSSKDGSLPPTWVSPPAYAHLPSLSLSIHLPSLSLSIRRYLPDSLCRGSLNVLAVTF